MSRRWMRFSLYLPGTILVMLGILVIFFPMLLVALISAGLILPATFAPIADNALMVMSAVIG